MIVCTGGSGTIGHHLPSEIKRLKTRLEDSVEARAEELRAAVDGPFSMIHLAGVSRAAEAEADPRRAKLLNVDGSVRWIEAAAAVGCRRFVFASSAHVFQPTDELEFIKTNRVPDAVSVYGVSKIRAEVGLLGAAARLGMDVVIARIFSVIDPNMRPGFLYAELQRRAREKDFSPLRDYQNVRDFSPAKLVAEQLWEFAMAPRMSRTIHNVASGRPTSLRELAEQVMRENGVTGFEAMFSIAPSAPNYLVADVS